MSFMDQIGGLLNQYAGGQSASTREEAHRHYDQIAQAVPPSVLGSAIGPALSSLGTDQVQERVTNAASEMSPGQRGDFVQRLLAGLAGSGGIGSTLSRLGISPQAAQTPEQLPPSDVGKLAAHVQQSQPGVFNQAMQFYADHPTLVKVLGTLAIAKIAQQLSARQMAGR